MTPLRELCKTWPRRFINRKHRQNSRFRNVEGWPCAAWTHRVIIYPRKFLLRTHGAPFFYFTRAITPLPRKAVPAHFSRERPLFLLSTFPRSFSHLPPTVSSLSLSVAQIYVQRQGSPPGVLVRDAGLEFLVPFPCCLCQRLSLFCPRFSVENRVKR